MASRLEVERFQTWFGKQHWAAWVISGIGLALAGLSLWYLIIFKALFIGSVADASVFEIVLRAIEICLLAGFSLVLVYGGYWLVSSPFDQANLWWAGLWTMIGLAGVVAIVALVTAVQVLQGRTISEPTLIQEMLLATGGGALGGLLIGISTVRETIEGERAKRQRDALLFVNDLLRHNVLNGTQVILGNTELLREHVDEDGQQLLDATEYRAEIITDLIQDVRTLMKSVSGELSRGPVSLSTLLANEIDAVRTAHPNVTIETAIPSNVVVRADELLDAVFENLLSNAVKHNDADEPHIEVTVDERDDDVVVRIEDNGPGIPDEQKELLFGAGVQGEGKVGQGLGLYLVDTLVDRYGGDVWFEDNEPRGTVVLVKLPSSAAT